MTTLIVDASNMAYRARYAYNLSHNGRDTSVTYGTIRMLMALAHECKPEAMIMCFDGGRPRYRSLMVPQYKANRTHDNDDTYVEYVQQVVELRRMLPYFGVLCVRRDGIEADDLMYHASRMLSDSIIVSNDDDMLQAVNDDTAVMKPGKKGNTLVTAVNFKEIAGVDAAHYLVAKALLGDSSDNIPGVIGVGPVTASKLFAPGYLDTTLVNDALRARIHEFLDGGTADNVLACIDMTYDLYGARLALLTAQWVPYTGKMVTKYCMDNAFASLMEAGSLGQTFGALRQPKFDANGWLIPRIWDTDRCPA